MLLNKKSFVSSLRSFGNEGPFDHCVIDDFFDREIALKLESEFPNFESEIWHQYDNAIEVKKVCNNWNVFPSLTYQAFSYLNSLEFLEQLLAGLPISTRLYNDIGLNGGGWHIHKTGGKLNTHLDYSVHPKLGLQRKLNLIVYLNSSWQEDWGGALGFWSNESAKKPGKLVRQILPKFNRAVLFDTTQNSWHGLPDPLKCPQNEYRKSLAMYYLCDPPAGVDERGKALFAPAVDQMDDEEVAELIERRAQVESAQSTYISKSAID